jgi:predicted ATP-grasp superfamily ATP-dependent carboligase
MPIKKFLNSNLKGFKLIIASAAVGNVSQLTSDLIIETLGLDKYGMVRNFTNLKKNLLNHGKIKNLF